MIPERLAWSLIQDGWILRNKICWHKPNGMPSSVKDRFTNKWEYIFLFSKSRKYYFDLDAVREEHKHPELVSKTYGGWAKSTDWNHNRSGTQGLHPLGKNPGDVFTIPSETRTLGAITGVKGAVKVPGGKGWTGHPPGGEHALRKDPRWCPPEGKNPGDFWSINTQPFPQAHFAVFPEKLCEKPIKAGCPEQVCVECGKARERIVEKPDMSKRPRRSQEAKTATDNHLGFKDRSAGQKYQEWRNQNPDKTIGWTSCDCNAGFTQGTVLDPFCGAGTAGVVAKKLQRKFIGIDIKSEYTEMSEKRIKNTHAQLDLLK